MCHRNSAIQFIPVLLLPWKNVMTASSFSGNHLLLGPLNFFHDTSHLCLLPCVSATVERCFHRLIKLQRVCGFPCLHIEQIHVWILPCIRFLVSVFHNYGTRQIGTSSLHILTSKAWAGFIQDFAGLLRKAHFMVLVYGIFPWYIFLFWMWRQFVFINFGWPDDMAWSFASLVLKRCMWGPRFCLFWQMLAHEHYLPSASCIHIIPYHW
jgi:hypothetical protein